MGQTLSEPVVDKVRCTAICGDYEAIRGRNTGLKEEDDWHRHHGTCVWSNH